MMKRFISEDIDRYDAIIEFLYSLNNVFIL